MIEEMVNEQALLEDDSFDHPLFPVSAVLAPSFRASPERKYLCETTEKNREETSTIALIYPYFGH